MSVRVHDLAKHCGISNKEMLEKLRSMNYPVKTHSSTVDKITAESIEKEYGYVPPKPEPPAPPAAPKQVEAAVPAPAPAAQAKIEVGTTAAPLELPTAPLVVTKPAAPPEMEPVQSPDSACSFA